MPRTKKIQKFLSAIFHKNWFWASLIFVLALFLRLWQLETIPPGAWYDEAHNATDALTAIENDQFPVYYPANFGREGLFLNIVGWLICTFGNSNFVFRFFSAFCGSLAVAGLFLLARKLKLSQPVAFLASFALATSFWHLNFSRIVFRAIMTPTLLIWSAFFFFWALEKRRWWQFILAGATLGLGLHTYISFRVAPFIFVGLAVALFFSTKNFFKKYWLGALLFLFSSLLVAAPILFYFYKNLAEMTTRTGAVSVFNAPGLTPVQAISKSLFLHLDAFFFHGDPNQRHNHASLPILPPVWALFFAFGFLLSIKEIFFDVKKIYQKKPTGKFFLLAIFSQLSFWIMLLPGVLSIEGIPHMLRIIGAIPAVFLLTAFPFEYFFRLWKKLVHSENLPLKRWREKTLKISLTGLIIIYCLTGLFQLYLYFFIWAKNPKTLEAFENRLYQIGRSIKTLSLKENNFFITSPEINISQDHRDSGLKTTHYSGWPEVKNFLFYSPSIEVLRDLPCQNTLYFFQQPDQWLLEQFQKKCPQLQQKEILSPDGKYLFWIMQ